MSDSQKSQADASTPHEPELQQGTGGRSSTKDDLIKRSLQKEPTREEPRVEDFDPDAVGTGVGRSSAGNAPAR
jgi:hypothetical protein